MAVNRYQANDSPRESLGMAAIGLGLGIPVAVLVARALRSMLFGLSPLDPIAFCLALIGITTVALVASYIPARYAASVDRLKSLRAQ